MRRELKAVYDVTVAYKGRVTNELQLAKGSFPTECHIMTKRFGSRA